MKILKKLLMGAGLLAAAAPLQADDVVSRTFIATGDVQTPRVLDYRNFWQIDDVPFSNENNLTVSLVGGMSTNSTGLRNYFSPFEKSELVVREQGTSLAAQTSITGATQDILSWNFNIVTLNGGAGDANGFASTISFTPKRSVVGVDFDWFFQHCDRHWIKVSTQLLHVKTDMQLSENVTSNGGGADPLPAPFTINGVQPVANMVEAFRQPQMLFGKIDGAQKKTGLADIYLSTGYNWKRDGEFYVQPYIGILIPTGNKPKAVYMFEPIVGNNQHFGIFFGGYYGSVLHESAKRTYFLSGVGQALFRFKNTQKRMIDPAGKPWGRYLTLYTNAAAMAADTDQWGINEFTKNVTVKPHFTYTGDLQLHIVSSQKTDFHLGYALRIQSAEEIIFNDTWNNPAISALDGVGGFCMPFRQINNANFAQIPATTPGGAVLAFVPVLVTDLDLNTAAQPYNTQSKFYGALSHNYTKSRAELIPNLGFAYTVASSNHAISSWELWAGVRAEF